MSARRVILCEASTVLWRARYAPTVARLVHESQRVANRFRVAVTLVACDDGAELRTFHPRRRRETSPTVQIKPVTMAELVGGAS